MHNLDDLKQQLDAVNAEWSAKRAAIKRLRSVDRVQNEGGDGFRSHEAADENLAAQYLPRVSALRAAIFAAEWTADVTTERRAAWNSAISKMGTKIAPKSVADLVGRLGYSSADIARAKAMHGIK